jgi:hypothetical protein
LSNKRKHENNNWNLQKNNCHDRICDKIVPDIVQGSFGL